MNMQDVEKFARLEMKRFGLVKKWWTLEIDHDHTRFGACRWPWIWEGRLRQIGAIILSEPFCLRSPRSEIEDTVWHEIAHALAGPHGDHHGPFWIQACAITGARPQACGILR